jgi:tripartite-type tricarboxylate transporter receptor subunit TctC
MKRRSLIALGAAGIAASVSPSVFAQARFPQRPITLVVPTPPGGSTDFTARLIAEPLTRALGQSVIVDNKPGGSGNIGNQFVARAKPDGYTLLMAYSGYQVGIRICSKMQDGTPSKILCPSPWSRVHRKWWPFTTLCL